MLSIMAATMTIASFLGRSTSSSASFWQGKRVLITGASSGLGEALSIELSGRGASLVLAARRQDRLAEVAAVCQRRTSAPQALICVLPLDVTSDAKVLEAKAAEMAAIKAEEAAMMAEAMGLKPAVSRAGSDLDAREMKSLLARGYREGERDEDYQTDR